MTRRVKTAAALLFERDLRTLSDEEWCGRYQPSGRGLGAAVLLCAVVYGLLFLLAGLWRAGVL